MAKRVDRVIGLRRVTSQDRNEQLVLETIQQLKPDVKYTIRFVNYSGQIGDDLRGLYRSSYRDENGTQRSVNVFIHMNVFCYKFVEFSRNSINIIVYCL